jgi:hypothetical protein
MVMANFEFDGNVGTLFIKTHFGQEFSVRCEKFDGEIFRLGGTAAHEVMTYEGLIMKLNNPICQFRAFRTPEEYFEVDAYLSPEVWDEGDLHCYATEYYTLDMENNPHSWLVSKFPIQDSNYIFINLDVLDGAHNLIKRYRVSPFTGQWRMIVS